MDELEVQKARVLRGSILKILYEARPDFVTDRVLVATLGMMELEVTPEELRKQLKFLHHYPHRNDGYVEAELDPVAGSRRRRGKSRLTPCGINLWEKVVPADVAIAEIE